MAIESNENARKNKTKLKWPFSFAIPAGVGLISDPRKITDLEMDLLISEDRKYIESIFLCKHTQMGTFYVIQIF